MLMFPIKKWATCIGKRFENIKTNTIILVYVSWLRVNLQWGNEVYEGAVHNDVYFQL